MKTISKLVARRLEVQKNEAEIQGMVKTAAHIDAALKRNATRDSDSSYNYSHDEYSNDIKNLLWEAMVRTADYYGKSFTAEAADQFVSSFVQQISRDAKVAVGAEKDIIGAHEPSVPGEDSVKIKIEE